MRQHFSGYYAPTEEQHKNIFKEALFVLDTNILLAAYKLPRLGRLALLSTLEQLKDQIWIPYQVGMEFQENRLLVIRQQIEKFDQALRKCTEAADLIGSQMKGLEVEKRDEKLSLKVLDEKLGEVRAEFSRVIERARSDEPTISMYDAIRGRLDAIVGDRVGPPPADQDAIDQMSKIAEDRYSNLVPPGFKDRGKAYQGEESTRTVHRLKYERQYGDYYLWRQTLDHVKASGAKCVVLVTSDVKSDWWMDSGGHKLAPLPALVDEMRDEAGCELFWMYRLERFLEHASDHLKLEISDEALSEVKAAESAATQPYPDPNSIVVTDEASRRKPVGAVGKWYANSAKLVVQVPGTQLLRTLDSDGQLVVKVVQWSTKFPPSDADVAELFRLASEGYEDVISSGDPFELVVLVDVGNLVALILNLHIDALREQVRPIIELLGYRRIVIGMASEKGHFTRIAVLDGQADG